ncbi:MAG: DUF4250 domain-containing protein [Butyrivibrio sp.]|nr:DUF4250 domain-containing protein [Butyrivibrio sp.]
MLPQDPVMLLSYLNTLLRDKYKSFDSLAEGLDLGREEKEAIISKLKAIGYEYSENLNQFR